MNEPATFPCPNCLTLNDWNNTHCPCCGEEVANPDAREDNSIFSIFRQDFLDWHDIYDEDENE